MEELNIKMLVGKVLTDIKVSDYEIEFSCDDGRKFLMYHQQDCCEDVSVDDINGDINDLIGSPIIMSDESTSFENPKDTWDESCTWTFYRFATVKGYVNIKWYGTSNGYYSESVDFMEIRE